MKSYHGGPIRTQQRSFERYHPRPPTASSSPRLGFATPPKTSIAIISGTGKATNFKFGRCVHGIHPNKGQHPINFFRENGAWAYTVTALSIFTAYSPDRPERKPIKNFGKSSCGRTQGLSKFSGHPYNRAHRAVIFAVAQLSCSYVLASNESHSCV